MVERQRSSTQIIDCSTFSLRVTREGPRLVGLEVDARHPNLPGMTRTFDLSEYLRVGLDRAATTVQQVLSGDVHESTRLDALRALTRDIATPELRQKGIVSRDSRQLAPSETAETVGEGFRIEKYLDTSWGDLLRGRTRQVISIVRDHTPLVNFSVSLCDRGEVVGASIHVLPLELRWPILDRDGSVVDITSVWRAVDDYIATLAQSRHYPWPQALETLAAMQDLRADLSDDQDEESVSCVMQVALAVLDENRYATDPSFSIVEPSRAPFGIEGSARALPDDRVLWTAGPNAVEDVSTDEFTLGGFSTCGVPYKVCASVPHAQAEALLRAVLQIRFSRSWETLERGISMLVGLPGACLSVTQLTQLEMFPREVCSLVERLHTTDREDFVRVGVESSAVRGDIATATWVVSGLVRGLAPIHARVDGPSYSSSWRCVGFLDEELQGQLVFFNQLGGELIVTPVTPLAPDSPKQSYVDLDRLRRDPSEGPDKQLRDRGERLEGLLTRMRESPETFAREVFTLEGFEVRSAHLPRHDTLGVYAMVDRLAGLWHRSLVRSRRLEGGAEGIYEFRARELSDGRWALARERCVDGQTSYHTIVVGSSGAESVYLSVGQRGWLGGLLGTKVAPGTGRQAFTDRELHSMFRLMASRASSIDPHELQRSFTNDIGKVSVSAGISMHEFDPERYQRDFVSIASQWLRMWFS